ncbi:MAG: tRNA (adenosine(37)-N6)-dimethylallyltransferase MiaA [Oscillospiraceae bacterium]|jgi:tRNA dimethylallyltransferase|nr:tRNA (adenosine(37)-N6)-dimethylallyltransferase MiaA [Oscillospiraceae bacterium]MCI1990736.1 tRNA (adenosine(37)-N6)-dimethylallyltransferase MiaA [Oscillospiraceae bacterium]MCI2035577.1 tRNA (adenosine(37)-N6)-dimethylallyltransferase MiaA [Oscillospiraceae bacterium]
MEKIPVAAVVGPTATGKTRLAAAVSLRFGGEVVSADSMQIYRGLDIGTAKPGAEERRGVPHHLIGFLDPSEPFSVADYVDRASRCIREIRARGKLPVVAGGTGLYVRSLLSNVRFVPQGRDDALRARLRKKAEAGGPGPLVEELRSFDPESAERIHPNNVGRLIRAIEIYRVSGVTMTEQKKRSKEIPPPYDALVIGLAYRDRAGLYEAIGRRVDGMMRAGLLEEAERVYRMPSPSTAAQAIGYKEFFPYFRGECSLEDAVESVKRESRRYAKRQLTWFRRGETVRWLFVDDFPDFPALFFRACEFIQGKGWKL